MLLKKIEILANYKNMNAPRSKASDKKKKRSPNSSIVSHSVLGAMGSTTMFQMVKYIIILTEHFYGHLFKFRI